MAETDNILESNLQIDIAVDEEAIIADNYLTYIRPLEFENNTIGYGVYSEDGQQLAVFGSYDAAFFSARQNNLNPVSIH